jgi:hypothetical protein
MSKLEELDDLNLLDPIQVRVNQRGDVSQEQRSLLMNTPSLVISVLRNLWSNITFLGLFLIGFIVILGNELDLIILGIYAAIMLAAGLCIFTIRELPDYKKRQHIQNDIMANNVREDSGSLVFRENVYQLDTGKRFLLLSRKRNGMFPGIRYRAFYLAESGVVLSAEEIELLGDETERQSYQAILSSANHFNTDALALNRAGILSRRGQWRQFSNDIFPGMILFFTFIGISIYIFVQYIHSLGKADSGYISLLCAGITLLIGLAGLYTFARAGIDIIKNQVLTVTGETRKAARMARKRSFLGKTQEEIPVSFYYSVGEKLFRVKESAYYVLIDGIRCTAYYTPRSKTLVNIEPSESPLPPVNKT